MKSAFSDFTSELINKHSCKEVMQVIDHAIENKDAALLNDVVRAYCTVCNNADIYMKMIIKRYVDYAISNNDRRSIIETLTMKDVHTQALTEGFKLFVNYCEYDIAKEIVTIFCERLPSLSGEDAEIMKSHLMYILPIILRSTYLDIAIQIYNAKANPERSTYTGRTVINSALGEGLLRNNIPFVKHIMSIQGTDLHGGYFEDIKSVEMLKFLLSKNSFRNALKSTLVYDLFKKGRSELLKYLYNLESFPKGCFLWSQNSEAALHSLDYKTIKFLYKVRPISQKEKNRNLLRYMRSPIFSLYKKSLRFLISQASFQDYTREELSAIVKAFSKEDLISEVVYLMRFRSSIDLNLVKESGVDESCVGLYLHAFFGEVVSFDEKWHKITNAEFYNRIFGIESTWSTKDKAARIVSVFQNSKCSDQSWEDILAYCYAKFRYINRSFADLTFTNVGQFNMLPIDIVRKIFHLVSDPHRHSCSSEALVSGGTVHNYCRYASERNVQKMKAMELRTQRLLRSYAVSRGESSSNVQHDGF